MMLCPSLQIWGLSMHQLIKTYPGEHSKASMFSRAPTAGVLQLHVTNDGKGVLAISLCFMFVCLKNDILTENGD